MPTHLRHARIEDVPRLTEIYNYYVRETTISFDLEPASLEERGKWFAAHPPNGPHQLLVAEVDGTIAGYASSSEFRHKAAYRQTVETSIYLAEEFTGRGLGSLLYRELFTNLKETDVHQVIACLTVPNPASVALHRKLGFVHLGRFPEVGYKFGKWIDIDWFLLTLK